MPLTKKSSNKAFRKNVETLMKDVGKSPHVQSQSQALAIAYSEKRRAARKHEKKKYSE